MRVFPVGFRGVLSSGDERVAHPSLKVCLEGFGNLTVSSSIAKSRKRGSKWGESGGKSRFLACKSSFKGEYFSCRPTDGGPVRMKREDPTTVIAPITPKAGP
jgi:hypothetical protein